ncbi:hypothetical protein [Micromonospora auratinigra]|uniref:Uncharacterized protein n=1 Tax=Micromonospora auratinigra TaxID=261654 RepID=A0A1A9A7V1_9ACTN|nr:hypothetical protein [Micromonospora auratinigra]SBT52556.1 hypothetical protein GA0070611_5687 [Micromonospora auratinigra]
MRVHPRYLTGLLLAAAAVLWWAVGMAVLQPLTEPAGPWSELLPGNNTYWAREVRLTALVGVLLGLLLAVGGSRRALPVVGPLGVGWLLADLLVDRADLEGRRYVVPLAAAGCLALAGAVALLHRLRAVPPAAPPARRTLLASAVLAAVLAVLGAAVESPTDREPQLRWAGLGTGLLLFALALAAALAAAPALDRSRRRWAVAMALVGVAVVTGIRLTPNDAALPALLAGGVVLVTGLVALAGARPAQTPAGRWYPLVAVLTAVGLPLLLLGTTLAMMVLPLGPALTRISGNIAISDADSDAPVVLAGLVAGLVLGALLARSVPDPAAARPVPTGQGLR